VRVERRSEAGDRRGGELEARTLAGMAERDRRVVEQRRQLFFQLRPPELDRRRLCRRGEHVELRRVDLDAGRRLRRCDHVAVDLDDGLGEERGDRVVLDDDLRKPARVAEDGEGHAAELAPVLQPPGQPDAAAHVGGQLVREDALHGGHLLRSIAWRCGREALPRCHRTSPPLTASLGPVTGAGRRVLLGLRGCSSRGSGVSAPSSPVPAG
jgi:hypothetical protein